MKLSLMHLEKGDIESARKLAAGDLKDDPEDPENWLVMGQIQAHCRDYDWAAQSFEKYLQCMEDRHGAL